MDEYKRAVFQGSFFFVCAIFLVALAISTLIQGILTQFSADSFGATLYYFVSTTAGGAAVWLYLRGITILKVAKYLWTL